MATAELLEKAAERLWAKAKVRNICPKGKFNTELGAMADLLKGMGFGVEFVWDGEELTKITGVRVSLGGETAWKTA